MAQTEDDKDAHEFNELVRLAFSEIPFKLVFGYNDRK